MSLAEYDERAEIVQDSIFRTAMRFDRSGDVLIVEMWVKPGGGVFVEHAQPRQEERLEVLEGEITATIDGERRRVAPGEMVAAGPGQRHAFRNTGDRLAHIHSEVEPALDLEGFLREATLLVNGGEPDGGLTKNPLAALLDVAELAQRYRRTVIFTSRLAPPVRLQPLVFGPLAWLLRRFRR